jgi:hypothetical protein
LRSKSKLSLFDERRTGSRHERVKLIRDPKSSHVNLYDDPDYQEMRRQALIERLRPRTEEGRLAQTLLDRGAASNLRERGFLEELTRRNAPPTGAQRNWLRDIARRCGVRGAGR